MNRKATFHNGQPTNLPAAAMDALEWCEWLYQYADKRLVFSQADSITRQAAAIEALKRELRPHLPARFTGDVPVPTAQGEQECEG